MVRGKRARAREKKCSFALVAAAGHPPAVTGTWIWVGDWQPDEVPVTLRRCPRLAPCGPEYLCFWILTAHPPSI